MARRQNSVSSKLCIKKAAKQVLFVSITPPTSRHLSSLEATSVSGKLKWVQPALAGQIQYTFQEKHQVRPQHWTFTHFRTAGVSKQGSWQGEEDRSPIVCHFCRGRFLNRVKLFFTLKPLISKIPVELPQRKLPELLSYFAFILRK